MGERRFAHKARLGASIVITLVAASGCGSENESLGTRADPATATSVFDAATSIVDRATSSTSRTSELSYPTATNVRLVEEGLYRSVEELAEASQLVVVGQVNNTFSLGRPNLAEDVWADEYIALVVLPESVLKGDAPDEIVFDWDAIQVSEDGERLAIWVADGVPPPTVGDRVLLFLTTNDPDRLNGVPTHRLLNFDGIAFLDDAGKTTVVADGSPLRGTTLDEIEDVIGG